KQLSFDLGNASGTTKPPNRQNLRRIASDEMQTSKGRETGPSDSWTPVDFSTHVPVEPPSTELRLAMAFDHASSIEDTMLAHNPNWRPKAAWPGHKATADELIRYLENAANEGNAELAEFMRRGLGANSGLVTTTIPNPDPQQWIAAYRKRHEQLDLFRL